MDYIKIQYFERIDVCEGIDVNTTSSLKESAIYHNSYFLIIFLSLK